MELGFSMRFPSQFGISSDRYLASYSFLHEDFVAVKENEELIEATIWLAVCIHRTFAILFVSSNFSSLPLTGMTYSTISRNVVWLLLTLRYGMVLSDLYSNRIRISSFLSSHCFLWINAPSWNSKTTQHLPSHWLTINGGGKGNK